MTDDCHLRIGSKDNSSVEEASFDPLFVGPRFVILLCRKHGHLPSCSSVPWLSTHHISFLDRSILQCANEITVAPSLVTATGSTRTSSAVSSAIRRRWVVCRTWLKPYGSVRIQVGCDPLQGCGNSALLVLIHCRSSLPSGTSGGLCV